MNKGLMSLFAAMITLAGVSNTFATAPTIGNIPDIVIGDAENNGPSDNNFFVFPNAFVFDDYASDDVTPTNQLKWSFDEGNPVEASHWYEVNGIAPVHVGTTAAAGDTSVTAAHVLPANDLRVASPNASFRDVVFSPTSGGSGPFPTPSADHSNGKVVTFYVSDGTYAASKDILVKTIDNASDSATQEVPGVTPFSSDTFSTDNRNANGWTTGGATSGDPALNSFTWDSGTGAYRITVASTVTSGELNRYRFAYWVNNRPDWLPYPTQIGTGKYVRAKYYMYNSGSTAQTASPNFNLRLQQPFAVTSVVHVQTHDSVIGDIEEYQELRPSSNSALPSVYRIDFDPIDVPYFQTASSGINPAQPYEGVQSSFEVFSLFPQDNGQLSMTQLDLGTYPISAIAPSVFAQTYDGTLLTDAQSVDVKQDFNVADPSIDKIGEYPPVLTGTGTVTNVGTGPTASVRFQTTSTPSTVIANVEREFYAGANGALRMRIAPDEQYLIKWKLSSTIATSVQGTIWLKARAAAFGYTTYLQMLGGFSGGNSQPISRQALPGTGTSVTNGEYMMIMNTPLDPDIRADVPGTLAQKMPNLMNPAIIERGNGSAAISRYRDIRVKAIGYDTLSTGAGYETERVDYSLQRIDLTAHPRVSD